MDIFSYNSQNSSITTHMESMGKLLTHSLLVKIFFLIGDLNRTEVEASVEISVESTILKTWWKRLLTSRSYITQNALT